MRGNSFLEEFRTHEEGAKRRRVVALIITAVLALPVSIFGTLAIGAALHNRGPESVPRVAATERRDMAHAELGVRCGEAVVAYDGNIEMAHQELEAFIAEAEGRIATLQQQDQAYQDQLSSVTSRPGVNYRAVGDLSREATEILHQNINEINQSIVDATEKTNAIMEDYTEKRNELVTCFNLVNERKPIPEYKVMEYDVLIREVANIRS